MAIYKLGELIDVHDNYRSSGYPTPSELQNNGFPFVKVADFSPNGFSQTKEYISKEKFDSLPKKGKITKGALLISAYGTIDVSIFNGEAGQMSSGVKELVVKNPILIKKFLYYWLIKNIKYMGTQSAVFLQLTIDEIKKTSICLPSLQTQQQIIDIIEPIENIETMLNQLLQIIINSETELFHKIKNESKEKTKRHNLVLEIKEKSKSELVTVVGVGYNGFTKKSGNISPFSKVVSKGEIAIGLISKDIPIGLNWTNSKFGISSIYKVIGSRNKNLPMLSWYVALDITDNWKNYIASTARQGQGFNITSFLNDEIHNPDNSKINEYNQTVINILDVKERIKQHIEDVKKQKEKVINYLLK